MKTDKHKLEMAAQDLASEGDVNLSPNRKAWARSHIDKETQQLLEEDAKYFLHQSLSTPCLNVLKSCSGATITDWQDRELLDFHGNAVHQVGYGNPQVIEALTPGARRSEPGAARARRNFRHRNGAQAGAGGNRAAQNDLNVGFVPRSLARCHLDWRRGTVPA